MTKARSITSKGVTQKYSDAIARLRDPGDCVVVVRGVPRTLVIVCPDGCGENITVNLDHRAGKAWRKFDRDHKLTIYPSVWRDTGCRAHFIVWNDHILWSGERNSNVNLIDESLLATVLTNLPSDRYVNFEEIADSIQVIPWDILWVCNELVRRNCAHEGQRGKYRKTRDGVANKKPPVHIDIKV